MDEADRSLPPRPSYVVVTLARREARLEVKEQLRAQGLKPQLMRAVARSPFEIFLRGGCASFEQRKSMLIL